jgi:hypothetical protein
MKKPKCGKRSVLVSPSVDYLRDYSGEHLWYEVRMFFEVGPRAEGYSSPMVEFYDNAMLECFALHLRTLVDFFYPEDAHVTEDDIVASFYYDTEHKPADFPSRSDLLKNAKDRANKHVAHLTKQRISGHSFDKQWDTKPLMIEMARVIDAFLSSASQQKLDAGFVEKARAIIGDYKSDTARP